MYCCVRLVLLYMVDHVVIGLFLSTRVRASTDNGARRLVLYGNLINLLALLFLCLLFFIWAPSK